jgi:hypothetical protein
VAYNRENRIRTDEGAVRITNPPDDLFTFFVDILEPGDADQLEQEMRYQASVSGQGVDDSTGQGIDRVEMFVVTYDGKIVSAQPERNANYCGFGDGGLNTPCNVWNFAGHGGKWPNGADINRTQYLVRVVAYAQDGRIAARSQMFQIGDFP